MFLGLPALRDLALGCLIEASIVDADGRLPAQPDVVRRVAEARRATPEVPRLRAESRAPWGVRPCAWQMR